ncbi:hypothetical protein V6N12_030983 [Hibiscus sabdariffa]|uniref:Reverse transcriptase domain-containing protein n=1 Tax=Hibiscus sabdariffa TaxID=183260 RepID=A0ABR2E7K4_9ROSI
MDDYLIWRPDVGRKLIVMRLMHLMRSFGMDDEEWDSFLIWKIVVPPTGRKLARASWTAESTLLMVAVTVR